MIGWGIQAKPRPAAALWKAAARRPGNTAAKRLLGRKNTTGECMEFPVWNELFTFSTGFSTGFVKKKPSFPSGFPLFPPGFQQLKDANPIRAVIQPALFWKVLGKFVDILPFIKKKVEGFSLFFTVRLPGPVSVSPIWNGAAASFQHPCPLNFPCGKSAENSGFPPFFRALCVPPHSAPVQLQNAAKSAPYLVFSRWLCYNLSRRNFSKKRLFL